MSTGLKKELGLGELRPQAQGSTKQADDFKAAYQAAAGPINECLQYTAAHAEQAKHDPQAGKRDTSCQAYQAALSRIDPTNPSVAQGAIDQVLAAVQGLKSTVESFKTAAEKAFNDWKTKEPELHSATDKIREMVDWGHEKAATLQQVIEGCVAKEKERAYEGAKTILDQLCGKLGPIYEEYQKQKAAKEEYEKLSQELSGRMPTQCEADYPSLEPLQTELTTIEGQMKAAADAKDFVKALEHANNLKTKLDEYEKKKKELEEKKAAYDKLAGELAGRMPTQCEADYPSLEPLQTELTTIEGQMKAAADTKDWDKATEHANSLKTKLDEYEKKKKELEEKKAAYDKLAGELAGRMPTQCEADYPTLEPLQTELTTIEGQMKAAADAKDWDKATEHANSLKTKLDEYEKKKKELEAKKIEYEKVSASAIAKVKECGLTSKAITSLDAQKQALQPLQKTMEASASAKDWAKAVADAQGLDTKAQEYLDAIAKIETETKKTSEQLTKELDAVSGVARKEKAREWAKKLTPDQLKTMSQDTRNRLMKELTEGGPSADDKAALNEIYKVRVLDPEYEKAAAKTREDFLKKLNEDPEMAEARKNWGTMSVDKRMEVLKKVAKVHTQIYGTEKIDGEPDMQLKPYDKAPTEDSVSNGVYDPSTGEMSINTNTTTSSSGLKAKFNDFDRAMDLVDHEANHRYQSMLAKKVAGGKLDKKDPVYKQAEAFMYNDKYYADPDDVPYVVYQNQPQESASRVSGAAVEGAHVGEDHHDHHHH